MISQSKYKAEIVNLCHFDVKFNYTTKGRIMDMK